MKDKNEYELDPLLETVLEEQMIEGGVPESEVEPSIQDIEESMDDKLKKNKHVKSMAEFNPYEMVGKTIELRETPGFIWEDNEAGVEDTPTILNGEYEVVEWDPGNYEFGLVTKEEGEISRTIPDDEPFTPTIYWVSSEYVDVPEEIVSEVEQLEKQYEMPTVQHPVEPATPPVQDFDPNALVGQFTVLDEVPCEDLQTGETEYVTGMFKVVQWDEANYGFILETNDDLQEQYWAPAEYVVPQEIAEPEVDMLDEQYGMPAVEHPLGEHTGAKVDFSNHLAIYRDPRPIGQFTKSEDGDWLAQISVNSRVPNNRRLPSAGDEALLKRGDSYYSVILQDRVNDPSDEINSVWTFEDAPEQNIDSHTASGLVAPGPGEEARGHHEFTPNPEPSSSEDIAAAAAPPPPPPGDGEHQCPNCGSYDIQFHQDQRGQGYLICNSCGEAYPLTPEGEVDEDVEELRRFLESRVEINRSSMPDEHLGFYEAAELVNKPFQTQGFGEEGPADQPYADAHEEFTDEEYASLSPEFQNDLRRVIKSLKECGVSQEDMQATILGLIHDYIRSGRSASEISDQLRADIARIADKLRGAGYDAKMIQDQIKRILEEEQEIDSSLDRQQMPAEHLGFYHDADFHEKGNEDLELPNLEEDIVMPDEPKGLEKD